MASVTAGPAEIGRRYDQSSPVSDVFNDGQVHLAYWYGDEDDTPMAEASRRITRKVADSLGLRSGERLLDAGCGLGAPALLVAEERGVHVTGITVSATEAARAEHKAAAANLGDRVEFLLGDYGELTQPDGSFDAIMAIESLQAAPDLAAVLRGFRRVLRPGGRIAVCDYTLEAEFTPAEAAEFAAGIGFARLPTLPQWITMLRESGFVVEEYVQCGPRVFGLGHKYVDSAERMRAELTERFDADTAAGLRDSLSRFFAPGAETVGYAIVTARKPVG
ncbi:cyclopropane fatty-acyl-phospholipid synthase-like methyltransferase [Actinoalloteichus hoggarensis]|uniref:Demethylrebeccamycin-D-glucose O-methyltransferase n=1 Tax=Actinoalloteichus hoggarensis TaxID=1470176 RepID=A0A221W5F5_9PSEU|nr:methyltransferase domain-containing protein [Actinoalloteichus hoggarensis]ASO20926.1 Demethylrebeccamycin-D-glucose O-methyltransferase [Actinoalloteichus hoggarensis]MBB5920856.1 cyclopropane fatty-acyl-phospholipid synthase-like methyltransferase [Actinoalloteichus hoggarensis]